MFELDFMIMTNILTHNVVYTYLGNALDSYFVDRE